MHFFLHSCIYRKQLSKNKKVFEDTQICKYRECIGMCEHGRDNRRCKGCCGRAVSSSMVKRSVIVNTAAVVLCANMGEQCTCKDCGGSAMLRT